MPFRAFRPVLRWAAVLPLFLAPSSTFGQDASSPPPVTFTGDIAPILQRACQNCHRAGAIAPMPLVTYQFAGKQYIVVAVSGANYSGELIAFKLPGLVGWDEQVQ